MWPYSAPVRDIRPWNLSDLEFKFLRLVKIKCDGATGLLLMLNSNIWPNTVSLNNPFQDIRLWNLSGLDIDLSGSFKVKYDCAIWLPTYGSLLMFNSNIWPNWTPLWNIRLQNLSDLEFDISMSLKVKSNGPIGLAYDFLLMYIVTTCLFLSV